MPPRPCTLRQELLPGWGWVLHGSCGERLEIGLNVPLRPEALPPNACPDFRARALAAFGPGGPRRLTPEPQDAWSDDPELRPQRFEPRWLGPNPGAEWNPHGDQGNVTLPENALPRGRR